MNIPIIRLDKLAKIDECNKRQDNQDGSDDSVTKVQFLSDR